MKLHAAASAIAIATALMLSPQALAQQAEPAQATRPNVFVWMLDDAGFAQLSSFGGLVETPNIDRVAHMGLRYSNYHTPPICSATRAAFLTGRNPHSVHIGGHAAAARPFPGYDSDIPASAGTVAENLRQGGYDTYAFGKWDHLPRSEQGGAGPYQHWPLGQGFERFYGFMAADTNNWAPQLTEDNARIATPTTPDYHLNEDLADRAIAQINTSRGAHPTAPFFVYWATGTAHSPHHAPPEWIARYRGRFDAGWDVAREQILQRQIAAGLVPANTALAPRPEGMPAWSELSADQRRLYARQMEVFAASLSYADAQFGRILDALEASGELNNTLIIITSDNGASAEGAHDGAYHEMNFVNGHLATTEENLPFLDRWGSADTYPHYAFGWAVAGNTPFRYYKQTTHEGGTHVPLVVAWPNGIAARGEVRNQFVYVTDLAPTILDAADVSLATTVNDVRQSPMQGESVTATFAPDAPDRSDPQYVEMYGNKGLWSDGWLIVTSHRTAAWDVYSDAPITAPWELYNLANDPGETHNLAAQQPDRVARMAREFEAQAARYNVNPIGNIGESGALRAQRARDEFARRGGVWRYPGPVARLSGETMPPMLTQSYRLSANVTLTAGNESGPIMARGGRIGGQAFYLRRGRPVFVLRDFTGAAITVEARSRLPRGASAVELIITRPQARPLTQIDVEVTIRANGRTLAARTVRYAMPITYTVEDTLDLGFDDGEAVAPNDYEASAAFPGELRDITFDFNAR